MLKVARCLKKIVFFIQKIGQCCVPLIRHEVEASDVFLVEESMLARVVCFTTKCLPRGFVSLISAITQPNYKLVWPAKDYVLLEVA